MKFWGTNELRFCVIARREDALPQYRLFCEEGVKVVRFILNCTAQDLFAELISPTPMEAVESNYYIYSRPPPGKEPTEKLGLKTQFGYVTLDNNALLCDNTKICEACFLCGTVTLFEICSEHWAWIIPLRNKKHEITDYALVDSEDFESLMKFKWYRNSGGYAQCSVKSEEKTIDMRMHRFIMNAQKGKIIDHINQIKIDNRRKNLRFVTRSQNAQNVPLRAGTSKYRGVSYVPHNIKKPWQATCGGAFLGFYELEEHAAYAYNCRTTELYGPQAPINDIPKPENYKPWICRNTAERVLIDGIEAPGLTIHKTLSKTVFKLRLKINGRNVRKQFTNIEEAKKKYLELKHQLNPPDPKTIIIPRNANGDAILPCTNTAGVIVDDDVYLNFHLQKVCLQSGGYPLLTISGKPKYLHRLVCEAEDNTIIDHIDNDKLHCKRINLRSVSHSLNSHNQGKKKGLSSKYIGVAYDKQRKSFQVKATKDGVWHSGGTYKDEKVAGFASDCLRIQLWGASARLNNVKLDGYKFVNNRAVVIHCHDALTQSTAKRLKT